MDCIRPEQLISDLWHQVMSQHRDCMIPGLWNERPDVAMHFQVRIDVDNHGYENNGNTFHPEWVRSYHRIVHVLVTARHRCYVAVTHGVAHVTEVLPSHWVNTSNHDSCWHSDGLQVFHRTFMEAWDHCWSHMPKEHQETPASMHKFCVFGSGFASVKPLSFVTIERAPIPDARDTYFDRIVSVKPLGFKIVLDQE